MIVSDSAPVGVLGGTFDPIHFGHLRLAEEAREALGLAQVRFIPAGDPPHRERPAVAPEQRLHMVRQAVAGNPDFIADDIEIRSGNKSYTVMTLERLRAHYGENRPLVLILGADAFAGIPQWYQWGHLLDLAHIAVAGRPGFAWHAESMPSSLSEELHDICRKCLSNDMAELAHSPAGHIFTFEMTPLAVSASLIRTLLQAGRSIRYLLPASVLDYIETNRLYR